MLIKDVQARIESLSINNDVELTHANELAKEIKNGIKEVKAFYKEPKAEASKAHKKICADEKNALKPWQDAEAILKKAIGEYMLLLEDQAKDEEQMFGVIAEKPDLGGTHMREYWDVEILDESKIPVSWNNHVIREVNVSALKDIARFTEGTAEIEGVQFYKKKVPIIR